ncbi:MAG: exodeoxyribonuclease VII large subunit [Thermoplasmata archaeon]
MQEESQRILSVTEVTGTIQRLLREESSLSGISVRGELSNCGKSAQGHCYFTLKDESSCLSCVMFRSDVERLEFDLKDGQKIIATGDIDVYFPAGSYQLKVREVKQEGVGELYREFLRLKKALEEEGLFAEEWKKPLPAFPKRIGVVTSERGAAFRDIVKVLGRRYPLAHIILSPSLVQGTEAPGSIVSAIELLNSYDRIDVMIVGRGGGSFEDLACFNNESVARTIFKSRIPIISAVGHETDFTIADFVADRRAATPSAAAEMAAPDVAKLRTVLDTHRESIIRTLENFLESRRRDLTRLEAGLSPGVVLDYIRSQSQRLDDVSMQMTRVMESFLSIEREGLDRLLGMLKTADPLATLDRGYSIALKLPEKSVVKTVGSVSVGDDLLVMVRDGDVYCVVKDLEEVERRRKK